MKMKHSKYRNTGILYELLIRQVSADIMNDNKNSNALPILKKYFGKNSELSKELALYQNLITEQYSSETKSNILIDAVISSRRGLNESALRRQKYNLIKEITESFNTEQFFATKIPNYKVYASIYKIFAANGDVSATDIVKSKISIVEHLIRSQSKKVDTRRETLDEFAKMPTDIRMVSYRLLIERFNSKYGGLKTDQKKLLREYINNISNTNTLIEYAQKEAATLQRKLSVLNKRVTNKVMKIKINEVTSLLETYNTTKRVTDSMLLTLLKYQELVHELTAIHGEKKK